MSPTSLAVRCGIGLAIGVTYRVRLAFIHLRLARVDRLIQAGRGHAARRGMAAVAADVERLNA